MRGEGSVGVLLGIGEGGDVELLRLGHGGVHVEELGEIVAAVGGEAVALVQGLDALAEFLLVGLLHEGSGDRYLRLREGHKNGGEIVILLDIAGEMPERVVGLGDIRIDADDDEIGRGDVRAGIVIDGVGIVVRFEFFRVQAEGQDKDALEPGRGEEEEREALDQDDGEDKGKGAADIFAHGDPHSGIIRGYTWVLYRIAREKSTRFHK